jgi:hypothetical protein
MLLPQIVGGLLMAGDKPVVPEFEALNPGAAQRQAIDLNLQSFPRIQELAEQYNNFSLEQMLEALRKTIPNFDQLMKKGSRLNLDMMAGKVPQDVSNAVSRNASERAVAGGYGGSGMARNLEARDLGLTSLDITQKGLDSASRWLALGSSMAQPTQFNASSMFLTPGTMLQSQMWNSEGRWKRDWLNNQIDALPDPTMAAIGGAIVKTDDQMMQIVASAAGGATSSMMCWVAREVFGHDNPKWLLFRDWLTNDAPKWFLKLYESNGERFAKFISNKPRLKAIIRKWMESRIEDRGRIVLDGRVYSY